MVIWLLQGAIASAILAVIVGAIDWFVLEISWLLGLAAFVGLFTIVVIHTLLRYRIWQFEIREDELYLERGVLTRVKTVVPYVRIQHVDSRRGPLERLLGLATTVVYTAGSRGADVLVPGLPPDCSEALQDELKQLAIESEGGDAV